MIVKVHLAAGEERDDGQQRDAGAVDLQPRDPASGHANISQDQDQ